MLRLTAIPAILALTLLALPAAAADFDGRVLDVFTGAPISGARVVALEAGVDAYTDADGRFALDVPASEQTLAALIDGMTLADALLREARAGEAVTLRLFGADSVVEVAPDWGAPLHHRPVGDDGPYPPVSLEDFLPGGAVGPLSLEFPGLLPESIRVGRRFASSCSGNPVQRVDTVSLEAYVQGVLIPEIGVFRAVDGGEEAASEVFKAFAIAARSYALYFYLRDPDAEFHIDDTACNQRYEDDRNAWVEAQVAATASQILVSARDNAELDKFEYAASCGRHGSRPEYQDALVPDLTGEEACVRTWCGHNDCAAHEVNPAIPDEGRCLVRGVCQWGAVERSMRGDSYLNILAHYQPNLEVITVGAADAPTRLVGFVRLGDRYVGAPVEGVTVLAPPGRSAVTNTEGFFELTGVDPGAITIAFESPEIVDETLAFDAEPGAVNWASIAVEYDPDFTPPDVGVVDAGAEDVGVDAPVDAAPSPDVVSDVVLPDILVRDADEDADAAATRDASADSASGPPPGVSRYSIVQQSTRGCGVGAGGGAAWWLAMLGLAFRRRQR